MNLSELHKKLGETFSLQEVENELRSDSGEMPWIGRLLMGVGGWLSSVFVLGFFAILLQNFIDLEVEVLLVIGGLLVGGSIVVSRMTSHPFFYQIVLAISSTGIALVLIALYEFRNTGDLIPIIGTIILTIVIYLFSKNSLQKSSAILSIFIMVAITRFEPFIFLIAGVVALTILLSGVIRKPDYFRPAIFGFLSGVFLLLFLGHLNGFGFYERNLVENRLLGIVVSLLPMIALIYLVRPQSWQAWLMIGVGSAIFVGISFGSCAIAFSLGVALCGRARCEPVLVWIGIAGLVTFTIVFYYFLGVSLLDKSYLMIGCGITLLLISVAIQLFSRWHSTPESITHE